MIIKINKSKYTVSHALKNYSDFRSYLYHDESSHYNAYPLSNRQIKQLENTDLQFVCIIDAIIDLARVSTVRKIVLKYPFITGNCLSIDTWQYEIPKHVALIFKLPDLSLLECKYLLIFTACDF